MKYVDVMINNFARLQNQICEMCIRTWKWHNWKLCAHFSIETYKLHILVTLVIWRICTDCTHTHTYTRVYHESGADKRKKLRTAFVCNSSNGLLYKYIYLYHKIYKVLMPYHTHLKFSSMNSSRLESSVRVRMTIFFTKSHFI